MPHPPYSLDMTLCDLFMFLKLKMKKKGCYFDGNEDIQTESLVLLDKVIETVFQEVFQQ